MRAIQAFALLICACAWSPAFAAEDDAGESDTAREAVAQQAAEEEAEAEPVALPERDADQPPAPAREIFVPTEEISEDIEVPFPVDI